MSAIPTIEPVKSKRRGRKRAEIADAEPPLPDQRCEALGCTKKADFFDGANWYCDTCKPTKKGEGPLISPDVILEKIRRQGLAIGVGNKPTPRSK